MFISAEAGIIRWRGNPREILRRKTLKDVVAGGYVEEAGKI